MNQTIKDGNAQGNPLGFAPIPGLIRKFAIPSIIGMLVMGYIILQIRFSLDMWLVCIVHILLR